jgi:6-phosphofructokinase
LPLDEQAFLNRVRQVIGTLKYCVVVVGEGLKDANGEEIGADMTSLDAFGHPVLSGAAERLGEMVKDKLGLKTRTVKLGYAQRAAAHAASETDVEEAAACGEAAVRAAVQGQSGFMVKLIRNSNAPYEWTTGLQPLADIANQERLIPRDWISEDGFLPNEKFVQYAKPLIQGDLHLPKVDGLPDFARLNKVPVEKTLPPYGEEAIVQTVAQSLTQPVQETLSHSDQPPVA